MHSMVANTSFYGNISVTRDSWKTAHPKTTITKALNAGKINGLIELTLHALYAD